MKFLKRSLVFALSFAIMISCVFVSSAADSDGTDYSGMTEVYRLYNFRTGEHFYTSSKGEKEYLFSIGWNFEQSWYTVSYSDMPMYRLYNANAGDHFYTRNVYEKDMLVEAGWSYEGVAFYSSGSDKTPMYRQYNPNAVAGAHNYTYSGGERDNLVLNGWKDEGVAFYIEGVSDKKSEVSPVNIYDGISSSDSMRINILIAQAPGSERQAYENALNVLESVGFNLKSAYNWSVGLTYKSMTVDPSAGCAYFANYGFNNLKGNCYVFSSTFYYMAKLLGYEAHWVVGYVKTSKSKQNHGWVEIDMDGSTYVFDPEFENSMARHGYTKNGYKFKYGDKGTWQYVDYQRVN